MTSSTAPRSPEVLDAQPQVATPGLQDVSPTPSPTPFFVVLMILFVLGSSALVVVYYDQVNAFVSTLLSSREQNVQMQQSKSLLSAGPKPTDIPTPTLTPTIIPLHSGHGDYSVGQPSDHKGPEISSVIFDPLDAQKGKELSFTVKLNNPTPVTSVRASLETDGSPVSLVFTKTDTNAASTIWTAKTTLVNSVSYRYVLTVTATAANGTNVVTVAPRGD